MIRMSLECGVCDSSYSFESQSENYEDTAWLMALRFMNGHAISCNFATPMEPVTQGEDDEDDTDREASG